jgi:hypothetical protein
MLGFNKSEYSTTGLIYPVNIIIEEEMKPSPRTSRTTSRRQSATQDMPALGALSFRNT